MTKFKFSLEDKVKLTHSDEHGDVIGRSEYINSEPTYLIRYVAGDGRQIESWWAEDALMPMEVI